MSLVEINGQKFGRARQMKDDLSFRRLARRAANCLVFVLFGLCLHAAVGREAAPRSFQSAASVLALDAEHAHLAFPATLRGVVTCTTEFGLFIQDSTSGIWVDGGHPNDFAPGDEVEVKGHTDRGLFSPVVVPDTMRKLGRAPLPVAKEVTLKDLLKGDEDAQYVGITGVVRSVRTRRDITPNEGTWLKIGMPDGFISVALPERDAPAARKLIDAEVRIEAPATCTKNLNRQVTSVLLIASSIDHVRVVRPPPADIFAATITPIGMLMQYRSGTVNDRRVRVTGTVTYYEPGERLILEERGQALLVMTSQVEDVKAGDQVDAVGFPTLASSGPFLQDAVIRYIGRGHPPKPTPVTLADLTASTLNYNLVSIEGKLLRRTVEPTRQVLLFQNGTTLLPAALEGNNNPDALKHLRDGSIVRVSGISVLEVEGTWNSGGPTASAIHPGILLRSPADVEEIVPPSWWTVPHLLYIAAILGFLVFVFFSLALYSRMEHLRLEAVLAERERLAHEIHDTLAQSFAGIGFQIQAIRRAIPEELAELKERVDLARALVRHSHTEARRSIEPIHVASLENIDLLAALEASARKMVAGGSVEVQATSKGRLQQPLPEKTADALLHMGQEAVANAVRHADPSHLAITVVYERDHLGLTVADDGCGFEERGDLLGFGLRGMRKRSAAISATLQIISSPGAGTRIEVLCPLNPSRAWASALKRSWNFISESGRYATRER